MSKKFLVSTLLFISLFSVLFYSHKAEAQNNTPLVLTTNLQLGSNGAEVSRLQSFLASKGYLTIPPGVTLGYFGRLTLSAVINFQRDNNIFPLAGFVGPLTRARLATISYGGTPNGNDGSGVLLINSISGPSSLVVNQTGTWTVNASAGSNGDQRGNLLYSANWGDQYCQAFQGNPCYTSGDFQSSPTFTHAYSQAGTYTQTFTVKNSAGQQVQSTATVRVGNGTVPDGCASGTSGGVAYSCAPTVSSLSPTSGPIDTRVTISGSGFTATGNRINFSGGEYYNLSNLSSSNNGTTITFNIPSGTDPACVHTTPQCYIRSVLTSPGRHSVSVTNQNGTSNSSDFVVTSASSAGSPIINSISGPSSLSANQTGTWTVNASAGSNASFQNSDLQYSANWGDQFCLDFVGNPCYTEGPFQSSPTFTHAYTDSGTFSQTFMVRNNSGQRVQTTNIVRVGGGGTSGPLSLSQLSPNSGPVGATVTIQGSGFTSSSNTIKWNNVTIATVNATNSNNNSLTFTVPSYYGPTVGDGPTYQVVPGRYDVTVQNANGTSNILTFTVTSGGQVSPPSISSLVPNSSPYNGSTVTISGSGFTSTSNSVFFNGTRLVNGLSSNGTSLSFTLTDHHCDNLPPGSYCTTEFMILNPGVYNVTVVNANGTSNPMPFTITSGNQTSAPTITGFSPSYGVVGQTLTIQGSRFTSTGNTVRIGSGQVNNVTSSNGTSLSFTIPSVTGTPQPVTVTNSNGTSNVRNLDMYPYPAPTATLTVNNVHDITVSVGATVNYHWSSTNGAVFESRYTNSCSGATGDWGVNTNAGDSSGTIIASQAGCTYVITYTVHGSAGSASDSITIRVSSGSGTSAPHINSVYPTSGQVTSMVTVNATGLSSTGNSVLFSPYPMCSGCSPAVISNLNANGGSLSFSVPTAYPGSNPNSSMVVGAGNYIIQVRNANNQLNDNTNYDFNFRVIASGSTSGGGQSANILQAISNLIRNNPNYLVGNTLSALLNLFDQLKASAGR